MGNSTQNTDTSTDAAKGQDEGYEVNWDAANEFFNQRVDDEEPATDDTDESDTDTSSDDSDKDDSSDAGDTDTQDDDLVDVHIDGRVITMAAEDAAVLEAYRRKQRARDGRLGGENGQLKERLTRLEARLEERDRLTSKEDSGPQKPPSSLAHTDFEQYMEKYDAWRDHQEQVRLNDLKAEFNGEIGQAQQKTAEQKEHEAWAAAFYRANRHLDRPELKPTVGLVFKENLAELAEYGDDHEGAFQRLGELATARIKGIIALGNSNKNKIPNLEKSGASGYRGKKKETPAKPFTASGWVDRKRALISGRG